MACLWLGLFHFCCNCAAKTDLPDPPSLPLAVAFTTTTILHTKSSSLTIDTGQSSQFWVSPHHLNAMLFLVGFFTHSGSRRLDGGRRLKVRGSTSTYGRRRLTLSGLRGKPQRRINGKMRRKFVRFGIATGPSCTTRTHTGRTGRSRGTGRLGVSSLAKAERQSGNVDSRTDSLALSTCCCGPGLGAS